MRNNLWNKDRRKDGLWFNQIGGGGIATGFSIVDTQRVVERAVQQQVISHQMYQLYRI